MAELMGRQCKWKLFRNPGDKKPNFLERINASNTSEIAIQP